MSILLEGLSSQNGATSMADVDRLRRAPTAWLIVFGVALMAAIAVGTTITIGKFRENAIESGNQALQSAVLLLVRHFDQQLSDFALPQKEIIAELGSHGIEAPDIFRSEMGTLAVHEVLRAKISDGTDVAGANVFDADGTLINSSQQWPVSDIRIPDRAYFQRLKRKPQLDADIDVVTGRFSSSPAIVLARRISGPHGEFLGVVSRAIAPEALESFFASAGLGPDASIAMHQSDGTLLARYPHASALIGQNFKTGPAAQQAVFEQPAFSGRLKSPIDGKDRLVASQKLAGHPLVIVATKTMDSVLAAWRAQTKFFIGAAAGSILIIALTLFLIFRQITGQMAIEKLRLATAINNMSQGLLMFDASEKLIVCNGKYVEMYGLSTDVVKPGCTFRDVIRHRKATGSFTGDVERYCT